ncbi:MAG: DRTGG domain-containing protein [Euryarchaeota archaeon]|jgi:BioD-like phosphotransacetylase family protein|nr:DRTGG domain-containing protein [Euryarchaeota archaeon]
MLLKIAEVDNLRVECEIPALVISSVSERSGKTVVALGLALNFKGVLGFYKPIRENLIPVKGNLVEEDAYLMKHVLNLEDESLLSPFTYNLFKGIKAEDIISGLNRICRDKQAVLLEGTKDISTGFLHNVSSIQIAKLLNAEILLVTDIYSLDMVAMTKLLLDKLKVKLKGVVLNQSQDPQFENYMIKRGIKILGSIPFLTELKALHANEIAEELGGEVIVEGEDHPIERILIGAMTPESALKYFRTAPAKAVITGGDRADIQLAALSTSTSCLVLTGGLYPANHVIARAQELGVSVVLVNLDTLTAAERLERLTARIDPFDSQKINLIKETVKQNLDTEAIWG